MHILEAANLDLSAHIKPGEAIVCTQACGEPLTLMETLAAQRHTLPGCNVFVGASFAPTFHPEHADALSFTSFGALGTNRRLAKAGVLGIIPCHVASIAPYIAQGTLPCDVLLIQLSPPDQNGRYTLGATADYGRTAAQHAQFVIAEINDQTPVTAGGEYLQVADIDIAIHTSRPLPQIPSAQATPADLAIAQHAAEYITDGAILQMGIGATPDAILRLLSTHKNLGIHSGMISDAVIHLMQSGIITNATKPIDAGTTVTGALIGTQSLYDFAHQNPQIALKPASYTHGEATLACFENLVTINSAIEVDLTGQINAEQIGDDYLGAIGGQSDFVRAAHRSPKGHAIVALPATAKSGTATRIVPRLTTGVTTPRTETDIIITEHGAAEHRGQTLKERAKRMINIAAPQFREQLEREAHAIFKRGY
jgi:acyl-CoA hydrolase